MTFAEDVKTLDPGLPLVLLPLRLEARYHPHDAPTELRVRILPDLLHADSHDPAVTKPEAIAGEVYWEAVAAAGGDPTLVADARRALAVDVGPYRALHVARVLRRSDPTIVETLRTPVARLVPEHIVVRAKFGSTWKNYPTAPTTADLAVAPALVDLAGDGGIDDWLDSQDLRWLVDFDAAEKVGMAVRIPMADVDAGWGYAEVLLAVGVLPGSAPIDRGSELDDLLEAQRLSRGLDLVPAGTPTNATTEQPSGVSVSAPDLDALFAADAASLEVDRAVAARLPATLPIDDAADGLSRALGRLRHNAIDRTPNAHGGDSTVAGAMNALLWPATGGHFLTSPLAIDDSPPRSLLSGQQLTAVRDWFIGWVRGGGPLSTLCVGPQPYGMLPVMLPEQFDGTPRTPAQVVTRQVEAMRPFWTSRANDAPRLSPGGGDEWATAQTMGATPHGHRFTLRTVDEEVGLDSGRITLWYLLLEMGAGQAGEPHRSVLQELLGRYRSPVLGPASLEQQLLDVPALREELAQLATTDSFYDPYRDLVDDYVVPLVLDRQQRSDAVLDLTGVDVNDGVSGDEVVRLSGSEFTDEVVEVTELVGEVTPEWLDQCIADAEAITATSRPTQDLTQPRPLLQQLVARTLQLVHHDHVQPVLLALRYLRANHEQVDLDRVLRETLGTVSYRLDAWRTSLATQRLATLRAKRPSGVQVGAYGWLQDVRRSDDAPSKGFIHATSMDHAATAAVLRSGWEAFAASQEAEAPLAVDLSSARVRAATWILDGVRRGQDLGTLLGGRFERRLHDRHLDGWIHQVRAAVDADDGVVDGLLLARAWSSVDRTDEELACRARVEETKPTAEVEEELERLAAELDAVADVLLAQTVHAIVQGDDTTAQASLSAQGAADTAVPPLDVLRTRRDQTVVQHRVIAAWDAGTTPAWDGPLSSVAPGIATWVSTLVPDPGDVVAVVDLPDGTSQRLLLDSTGLPPLELALLCHDGATQQEGRLARLLRGHAPAGAVVHTDRHRRLVGDDEVSVDEFGLLGATIAGLLGDSRALRATDLTVADGSTVPPPVDVGALRARGDAVAGAISAAMADLPDRAALAALGALRIGGALAALETHRTDVHDVIVNATRRIDDWHAVPDDADLDTVRVAVRRVTGGNVPVVTPFAHEGLAATTDDTTDRWLRQVGHVRAAVGRLRTVEALAEACLARPVLDLAAVDAGGLQLVQVAGAAALSSSQLAGLVLDGFSDAVPSRTQDTAVAVHFDAPTSRPPQAVLLAVQPPGGAWSPQGLQDLLLDTLVAAQERAVGPTLAPLGQTLPAVYLPEDVGVSA